MTNLQGAIACAQFERLEETINKKIELGNKYQELLKDIPAQLSCKETTYAQNHYWIFGIVLNNDVKFNAKQAMQELRKSNIETRPFFYPMHKQPVFAQMDILDNINRPVSENLYEKGFYIPMGLNLTDEKLEFISNKIKDLFNSKF